MADITRYFKITGFFVLFGWISFFPPPIQERYRLPVQISLFCFLLFLISDKKYPRNLLSIQDWPLWLFLISLFTGVISAVNKETALSTYLYLVSTLLIIFYIGKILFYDIKDFNALNIIICVCSAAVALFGILEVISAHNVLYEYVIDNRYYSRYISYKVRPMSTQLNPAPLASYLLVCWPFAIYSLNGKKLSSKILGAATIVLDVACLLLTFCRSAFLGLACMIFFYLYVKMGHKKLIAALIIFVIFVGLLYLAPYPFNRLGPAHMLFLSNGAFSEYRLTRIRMVWEIFKSRPFLGIGFNHFRILFDTYHSLAGEYSETPYEAKIADNMYLTLLAEAGAIGLVSFLIFIFYLFKKGLRALLSEKQKQKKQMLFISLCALTALLVDTAGYELFYWENPYMLFCLICGFVCGLFSQEQPDNI